MAKILNVPYRSQWDDDANRSTTDCGPACLAMVLGYYGRQISINELFSATGAQPGTYIGFGQLQRIARNYSLEFNYDEGCTLNDLKRWIDQGKPPIALVKYSYWSQIEPGVSTQDTFSGPHFVVVVGYGQGNIYVNDPNYRSSRREEGHKKAWSEVLFNLAWSYVRTPQTPNPNNAVIVPVVGKVEDAAATPPPDTTDTGAVIDYAVQQGDSWSSLAGKFYGDQTRYPEILAFNNLNPGAPLYVGLKLRIPVGETAALPDSLIVLGEGAVQTVDVDLVNRLKTAWIDQDKLTPGADNSTVLRTFVTEIERWKAGEAATEYVVQSGDTWAGIAGQFLGDQTRYRDIIEFNQLPPNASLHSGQKLLIPPV